MNGLIRYPMSLSLNWLSMYSESLDLPCMLRCMYCITCNLLNREFCDVCQKGRLKYLWLRYMHRRPYPGTCLLSGLYKMHLFVENLDHKHWLTLPSALWSPKWPPNSQRFCDFTYFCMTIWPIWKQKSKNCFFTAPLVC